MAMTNELHNNKKPKKEGNAVMNFLKSIIPWKGDSTGDVIRKCVLIAAIIIFIVVGVILCHHFFGDPKQDKLQDSLLDLMSDPSSEVTTTTTTEQSSPDIIIEVAPPEIMDKYDQLLEINSDTIGFIRVPGNVDSEGKPYIEYPVLQTTDNSFYVDKDFNKEYSAAGWIFADYKIPITAEGHADNIVLHGHNMANGSMFRHLNDYKSGYGTYTSLYDPASGLEVLKDANMVEFDTLWEENDYVIFGIFLTGIYDYQDNGNLFKYHTVRNFEDEAAFNDYYDNVMKRSMFLSDIEVEYGDELITLSTCTGCFDNSRLVVVARKLRDGETAEQYIDTYKVNPNPWLPYALYEVYPWLGSPNH